MPGGTWWPAADIYYQTSYISVGIETIFRDSEIFYPCEKTFDPLIKGNFPLIFSAAHSIERLRHYYGFKFPDWIDYSYDRIDDTEDRFNAYLNSIKKIAETPLHEIHELYLKDKHILDHNKNVFFNKSYDFLYPKIKDSMQHLGWY